MLIGNRPLTRSRLAVLAATVVVGLGMLVALGAFWLSPARAAVGPLPPEALVLPADVRFVAGLDVQRFVASPLYKRTGAQRGMQPAPLTELQQKTGLDPARDVQQIVFAGSGSGSAAETLVIAVGRYDVHKITRALETEGKVRRYSHEGATAYALKADGQRGTAMAFMTDAALLFGAKERVEAALASRTRGQAPLRQNAALLALVEKVRPGSTFWMVGDQSLLASLPGGASPGGGAGMFNLQALRSLTVTGDLEPQLSIDISGETTDEASARNLADMLRGLVAMLTMQAQQKPELQQLAAALSVATETNHVRVSARIPYALLDAIEASMKPKPPAVAPPPPADGPAPRQPK